MIPAEKLEIAVRIPRSLASRALRSVVGLGLLYVARGRQAPVVEAGPSTTYRIKLDATAQKYLPVASRICGSEREAIVAALSWLQQAPEWLLAANTPISTTEPSNEENDAAPPETVELDTL